MEETTLRIDVDENPNPAWREAIGMPLRAFNESRIGPLNAKTLAILLRDPSSGEVTGGLWGLSAVAWLYVELLVVPEVFRGRGLGGELMRKAEEVARKRGCIGIWLHTGTFQAPGFYERLGFTAFGTLPDYPPGHATVYYMKRLDS
jgi:GNAT superfamily N-acetyltransferase